jgi:hypothetical protein
VVDIDEGNNEGVCDDVLDMEKIVTSVVVVERKSLSKIRRKEQLVMHVRTEDT